jgi:nucleoside-diphosphate-sugar epimerase
VADILIAGQRYIASELANRLVYEGHRVWTWRSPGPNLPEAILPLYWEAEPSRGAAPVARTTPLFPGIAAPPRVWSIPEGFELVFYIVAASGDTDAHYREVFVDGLARLLALLHQLKRLPRRLFLASTTAVYGQKDGSWVDEESPTAPEHHSGRRMLEGEVLLSCSGIPATVVRYGAVYGPGQAYILDNLRAGNIRLFRGPPVYLNLIHRIDSVRALLHLMRLEEPASIYNAVDGAGAEFNEIVRWLAAELGRPVPPYEDGGGASGNIKRCRNERLLNSGFWFGFPCYRDGFSALTAARRGAGAREVDDNEHGPCL